MVAPLSTGGMERRRTDEAGDRAAAPASATVGPFLRVSPFHLERAFWDDAVTQASARCARGADLPGARPRPKLPLAHVPPSPELAGCAAQRLWLSLDSVGLLVSMLTHLVIAIPVRDQLASTSWLVRFSGFWLAGQEAAWLLLMCRRRAWWAQHRMRLAIASRLFRLAMHTAVWLEWPLRGDVVLVNTSSSARPRADSARHGALHSLFMSPLQVRD